MKKDFTLGDMNATRRPVHTPAPFAKVWGTAITYPSDASVSTPKQPAGKRSRPQPVVKPKRPL